MSAAGERFVRGSKRRLKGAPIRTVIRTIARDGHGQSKDRRASGQRLLPCVVCRGYPQETRPDRFGAKRKGKKEEVDMRPENGTLVLVQYPTESGTSVKVGPVALNSKM